MIEMMLNFCWLLGNFHAFFLSSADFFQNQLFQIILSGILSECQTVWIQIRSDILSGQIWVQTVCKSYLQTTLLGKTLKVCIIGITLVLTPKGPPIICSRRQFQILLFFQKKQIRHDISLESSAGRRFSRSIIPYFFRKLGKMLQNLSSAAVVIDTLRVKLGLSFHLLGFFIYASSEGSGETVRFADSSEP